MSFPLVQRREEEKRGEKRERAEIRFVIVAAVPVKLAASAMVRKYLLLWWPSARHMILHLENVWKGIKSHETRRPN